MSLYAWKRPLVTDTDEAKGLIALDDETVFEPSAHVTSFFAEVMEHLPPHESFTEEELAARATPWADSPAASDRLVWLSIRWGADDDALDAVVELARKHDLVLYDPQGPSFHSPAAEHDDAPYVPSGGEFVRGALLAAVGMLLIALAWKASIPVLSWIVIFVGGFVALVAVVSLAAISQQAWRTRSSRGR